MKWHPVSTPLIFLNRIFVLYRNFISRFFLNCYLWKSSIMSEIEKWAKIGNNKKAVVKNADMSGDFS